MKQCGRLLGVGSVNLGLDLGEDAEGAHVEERSDLRLDHAARSVLEVGPPCANCEQQTSVLWYCESVKGGLGDLQ